MQFFCSRWQLNWQRVQPSNKNNLKPDSPADSKNMNRYFTKYLTEVCKELRLNGKVLRYARNTAAKNIFTYPTSCEIWISMRLPVTSSKTLWIVLLLLLLAPHNFHCPVVDDLVGTYSYVSVNTLLVNPSTYRVGASQLKSWGHKNDEEKKVTLPLLCLPRECIFELRYPFSSNIFFRGHSLATCELECVWVWQNRAIELHPATCQGSSHFAFRIVYHKASYVACLLSISISVFVSE